MGECAPLLAAEQVLLFGWGPEQATPFEREVIERRAIEVVSVGDVAADPEGAATSARRSIERRSDRVLVHLDVDVIDFTDMPLSSTQTMPSAAPVESSASPWPWPRA